MRDGVGQGTRANGAGRMTALDWLLLAGLVAHLWIVMEAE
jgi:hypothetical protein